MLLKDDRPSIVLYSLTIHSSDTGTTGHQRLQKGHSLELDVPCYRN